jgi:hypothetical protein
MLRFFKFVRGQAEVLVVPLLASMEYPKLDMVTMLPQIGCAFCQRIHGIIPA